MDKKLIRLVRDICSGIIDKCSDILENEGNDFDSIKEEAKELFDVLEITSKEKELLVAIIKNRHLCFIPEKACPEALYGWTERAKEVLGEVK